MFRISYYLLCICACLLLHACNNQQKNSVAVNNADASFDSLKQRFMDAYWKQNPSGAIYAGYGKYYDTLKIPDRATFASDVAFSKNYLDSLHSFTFEQLSDGNKIDYKILDNQLRSTVWYIDTFKSQEWDPSNYNLGGEIYEIINRNFAPLNKRLEVLTRHLKHADAYFAAAIHTIKQPTKEHTALAVQQNEGSLDELGAQLEDSIRISTISQAQKDSLHKNIDLTKQAIINYVTALKKILADKNYRFRDFRIGPELFDQKFRYDIVTDHSAKEMFDKAVDAKNAYHREMFTIADTLWKKYCGNAAKPADSLALIKTVIDKIALQHTSPKNLFDTINSQLRAIKRFIIQKDLFAYDTAYPVKARIMPAFMGGVTLASASGSPPYEKRDTNFYNVANLTAIPAGKAESQLREYNNYTLQILTIHEAIPGHCMQGVYNNNNSSDIVKSVFGNGAMIEGWAVYCERMMVDNGWAGNAPEMWLMLYKWNLRECCNVIVDYGIHCLNYSKDDIVKLLKNEAFQEDAQIEEKYHRATVSQVQLCSYFTGSAEIFALRDAYKAKKGSSYNLKDFHEKFLSYGSAPVKFIRQLMLGE